MKTKTTIKLAIDSDNLPTAFRLFKQGWNNTENGRFLFDDKAAQSVMTAYAAWGVDLAIDLEHQMLELEGGAPDPTARDARGWCKLETRDGELWATDVRWTPDGAQRLSEKRQRYVSPAFEADPKTKRVLKMINVAITAMPATHKTPALVAASVTGGTMDPSLVKQALEAIEKGDAKAALDILKGLVASAAGAEPDADGDEDGSEGDGAEGVAPPADAEEKEAVEKPKVVDAAKDASSGQLPDDDGDEDEEKPMKNAARRALTAMLCRLTSKKNLAEAVAEVEVYRASHMTLESERTKLAQERALIEAAERRQLCINLVKLGAEFPATVWADDKSTTLKPRWLNMPLAELRSHVADQKAARVKKNAAPQVQPAAGQSADEFGLTVEQLAICKATNCEPKDFARLLSIRDGK